MTTPISLRSFKSKSLDTGGDARNFSKSQSPYGEGSELFQIPGPLLRRKVYTTTPKATYFWYISTYSFRFLTYFFIFLTLFLHLSSYFLHNTYSFIFSIYFFIFSSYFLTKSHRQGGGSEGVTRGFQWWPGV